MYWLLQVLAFKKSPTCTAELLVTRWILCVSILFSVKGKAWLIVTNKKTIGHFALTGLNNYEDLYTDLSQTMAVDLDIREGKLYWTDGQHNTVYLSHYPLELGQQQVRTESNWN